MLTGLVSSTDVVLGISLSPLDLLLPSIGMPLWLEMSNHRRPTELTRSTQNLIPLILLRPLRLCLPSETIRSARIVLLKITHSPYIAGIWIYEELNALSNRWQSTSRLQRRRQTAHHKLSTSRRLRRPAAGSGVGTPAPKTPVSGRRIPSAGFLEQESEAAASEAPIGPNSGIEQLRASIERFMTKVEADNQQSSAASAANAQATRALSTHLQALIERIETQQISTDASKVRPQS